MKILVLNGPSLNLLGIRQPQIYGTKTYKELTKEISEYAEKLGIYVEIYQSNHEGDLIDKILGALNNFDGIVINPAAYTHTSIALQDALSAVNIPAVEVHISDIKNREDYRKISYVAPVCIKTISGEGTNGYLKAIDILAEKCHVS